MKSKPGAQAVRRRGVVFVVNKVLVQGPPGLTAHPRRQAATRSGGEGGGCSQVFRDQGGTPAAWARLPDRPWSVPRSVPATVYVRTGHGVAAQSASVGMWSVTRQPLSAGPATPKAPPRSSARSLEPDEALLELGQGNREDGRRRRSP